MDKRKRLKPLPKDKQGRYDKTKIKELYLEAKEFNFQEFCAAAGYRTFLEISREFPLRAWRDEKIRKLIGQQDDEVLPEAIDLRKTLNHRRLSHMKTWDENARLYSSIIRKQIVKDHTLMDQNQLTRQEQTQMLNILLKMQELERRSLLIPTDSKPADIAVIPSVSVEDQVDDVENERIQDMEFQMLDKIPTGLKSEEIHQMMGQWFDQTGKAAEDLIEEATILSDHVAPPEPEPEENNPLILKGNK